MDVVAKTLDDALRKWEKEYGSENRSDIPGIRFGNVIEAAYRRSGRQVVILVDEAESIKKLAEANGLSEDECRQKLAMMYIILELMGEYVEVERATSNGHTSALPQPGLPPSSATSVAKMGNNVAHECSTTPLRDEKRRKRFPRVRNTLLRSKRGRKRIPIDQGEMLLLSVSPQSQKNIQNRSQLH